MKSLHSLGRDEKLKSKKDIDELFANGIALKGYPILFLYLVNPTYNHDLPKVAFSVPKKKIKRAVDRNLIKRRMREAYRLQKELLCDQQQEPLIEKGVCGMFIYLQDEIVDYDRIYQKMATILTKLIQQ